MFLDKGCANVGGSFEFSPYGWIANASMIGVVRPDARYVLPRSAMNVCGECVCLVESHLSPPRGESATPITLMSGLIVLSVSYVCASRSSYDGAARSTGCFFTYLTRLVTSFPCTRTRCSLKP